MKILWLVNIVMPELAVHLGQTPSVFGGWLTGAMKAVRDSGHSLAVCTTVPGKGGRYEVGGVTYYLVPQGELDGMSRDFCAILSHETPDAVHIYGTEFAHCWALARICTPEQLVVTVQGSLEYYKDEVFAGISEQICKDNLVHKLLRAAHKGGQSIELQKNSFYDRAKYEVLTLRHARYIHGGSNWGCAVARSINPACTTFDFGLTLRDSFYTDDRWNLDLCQKHTIYALVSYPIKGFHKLLAAMPIITQRFPDTKIYVIGNKIPHRRYSGLKKFVQELAPDYQWYLQKQIEALNLAEHLDFLGYLDEPHVKEQLLKAHVFVSPSSIENQSTALGEAMILGVPSVASCVGAMQEMIDHGEDGFLYPFNETYMLADHICRIFEDPALARQFSLRGREHACRTYDREKNCRRLLDMYETIAGR